MEEPVLKLFAAALFIGVVFIDRWAVKNYDFSKSAQVWCKAQFVFSRDPRGAVTVSSYVVAIVAAVLAVTAVAQLFRILAG